MTIQKKEETAHSSFFFSKKHAAKPWLEQPKCNRSIVVASPSAAASLGLLLLGLEPESLPAALATVVAHAAAGLLLVRIVDGHHQLLERAVHAVSRLGGRPRRERHAEDLDRGLVLRLVHHRRQVCLVPHQHRALLKRAVVVRRLLELPQPRVLRVLERLLVGHVVD